MTKIEELKEKAKVGWASFISFEALTSTAAPKLVQFSGARQGMKLLAKRGLCALAGVLPTLGYGHWCR